MMRKNKHCSWLISRALVMGFVLAVCGSSPASAQEAAAPASVSLDGIWELPNGQIQLIKGHTFILYLKNMTVGDYGIITNTADTFTLQIVGDGTADFGFQYTADHKNITVTSKENEWMQGIWEKRDDIHFASGSEYPLIGYWKNTTGEEIKILHVLSDGWGDWYTLDKDYNLKRHSEVEYDDEKPSEFKTVIASSSSSGRTTISFPYNYVFDGPDVLVGIGDDVTKYDRYVKD